MDEKEWEGFQALAYLIKCPTRLAAQLDPNPKIGRLYLKEFDYLMKMQKENVKN